MKFLSTVFLALFLSINSYAQFPMGGMGGGGGTGSTVVQGKISGVVLDVKTKKPVEFVSVALTSRSGSTVISGTLTDEKGYFKLENIKTGKYKLNFTFVGYTTKTLDSINTTPGKPDLAVGKIYIEPSIASLKEVEVVEEAPIIENKIDKLVYNAEKDITSAGGDASDVLRKVPMVSVDIDGNVELRGSQNIRVLINGKPSATMANSIADAMKMIPADQIKSVEVITNPSAKYDAEGTAGIINIITKKRDIQGVTGSVSAGAGTRNNTLNGNLNIKKNRFGINTSVGGQYNFLRTGNTEFYREDTYGGVKRELTQSGDFTPQRMNGNGSVGIDYDVNAYNSLSTNFRGNYFEFNRDNNLEVVLEDPYFMSKYSRVSESPTNNVSFDWTADYKKTFEKFPQREFSTSFQISQNSSNTDYTLEQIAELNYFDKQEKSFNDGLNREYTGQMDYTHPVKKFGTIETGAKAIYRDILSDYLYQVYNPASSLFENDLDRSNKFAYKQGVYAGYAVVSFKIKEKTDVKPGVRYEYTDNLGDFTSGGIKVKNSYDNIIPSFTIARTMKKFRTLKLSYSQRIQRPGMRQLNPFVEGSDPRNVSKGNPYLTPELSHNIDLSISAFSTGVSGSASVYYRKTNDVIQNYTFVDTNGVSVTTFENIGQSDNYGVNLFGQVTFLKKITFRGSVNMFYSQLYGDFNSISLSNGLIQYNMFLNLSWQMKKGFSVEGFGMFNSARATLQGKNPSMSFMNMGVKKEIWDKKGSIGLSIFNPFKRDLVFKSELTGDTFYQSSSSFVPFRSIGVSFSYRFGKLDFSGSRKKGVNNDDIKKGEGNDF